MFIKCNDNILIILIIYHIFFVQIERLELSRLSANASKAFGSTNSPISAFKIEVGLKPTQQPLLDL